MAKRTVRTRVSTAATAAPAVRSDAVVALHERVAELDSERKAVDRELRRAEERFHRLVDAVVDYAVFMLDPEGHVATWNKGGQRSKGYAADEIIGKHFSIFYTPEDRIAGRPAQILDIVRREERFEEEGWRVRKDGSRFWANVVITALRDDAGELTGFAKVTRDLTVKRAAEENERKLAGEQLAREALEKERHQLVLAQRELQQANHVNALAREELERLNRAKDEFLATMSHELRTPLNAIAGWATILRNHPFDAKKLERGLEIIDRNAKAQTRIVNDLVDVSRIIGGKLQLAIARIDVATVIHAATDVVRPAADSKGVDLVLDIDPDIGVTMADPDRLQQILWNLLVNAVRFTPRGGHIVVVGERTDAGVVLRVHDTGSGIASEHIERIFDRFHQIDSSTTRVHGGLGLGLAIVRHLVEAHGGTVEASSPGIGQGTTFTVTLPIQAVARTSVVQELKPTVSHAALSPTTSQPQQSLRNVRVLVVDDEPDSLNLVREVLENAGATVTIAGSAREALGARGPFEIIISDIAMPEMDGYAFMRNVRSGEFGADVPAIALTAYTRMEDVDRAIRAGFQEHLTKPIEETRLLETVKAWAQTH